MSESNKEFLEKIKTVGVVGLSRVGHKATHKDIVALCADSNSVEAQIARDKVMYKHITEGNADDKKLRREAYSIRESAIENERAVHRKKKKEKITELKKSYRRKYGVDA